MLAEFQRKIAGGLLTRQAGLGHSGNEPRGFDIHSRNARLSLRMALCDTFPVTQRLVGESFFAEMADLFVRKHPPKHGWLSVFGEGFPDFVADYAPASEVAYLSDLAKIEWARVRAGNAPDLPGLDLQALLSVPPEAIEQLHLRLHNAATLITSPHPVFDIWQAHRHSSDENLPAVDFAQGGQTVLVFRPGPLEVGVALLSFGDAALLTTMSHSSFGNSCQAAVLVEPDYDLGAKLGHLVGLRAFAALATAFPLNE